MGRSAAACLAGLLAVAAATAEEASKSGAWWQRLVTPGPLSAAHADLSEDCAGCHKSFDTSAEASLCLECHEPVALDLAAGEGFHGRLPGGAGGDCRTCHAEHKGRDFDVLGLDPGRFDHGATDFPLLGGHAVQDCAACHGPDEKHRDAPADCVACHREDDAHGGSLGEDCASCHRVSLEHRSAGWRTARFDHDETRFPLTGAHASVDCGLCHVGPDYQGAPSDCYSCHRTDDAHAGGFGTDCASCHDTARWTRNGFDHLAVSGFALRGSHAAAACSSCHVEPPGATELPTDCVGCHRLDDAHRGTYGNDCGSCHEARTWSAAHFEHAERTGFALEGVHGDLLCASCHSVSLKEPALGTGCRSCHLHDDAHAGELGRSCGDCHAQQSFATQVFFDHEITRFPLLGLHAIVGCEDCHTSPRFHDAGTACADCHRSEDVHRGSLGSACAECHNPNGWAVWRFDHDAQTRFPLSGSHGGLACSACHRASASAPALSSDCDSCHAQDDAHRGSFGRDCSLCHDTDEWLPARIGRGAR